MTFEPKFTITPRVATLLMRIEAARQAVQDLPITPGVLASLRETARLYATHYSTLIEGNRLTQFEVSRVIEANQHFPGRERDEKEVLGYYAALDQVEKLARAGQAITEPHLRSLHALVMSAGRTRVRPTHYRDGQNVIRDSRSQRIVYLPPEAKDVPALMQALVSWLAESEAHGLPCPLRAGIAHYQFATIHPYYDGNGRTARLLTTLVLHRGGYDLKGLYSLEEYYARELGRYYDALTIGPGHNYYSGRAEAEITSWVEYFCAGVADSFEKVRQQAQQAAGAGEEDRSELLRQLDPRQRKVLELFRQNASLTSAQLEPLFGISQRAARNLLGAWVESRFITISDPANRSRKYSLHPAYSALLKQR